MKRICAGVAGRIFQYGELNGAAGNVGKHHSSEYFFLQKEDEG
jgi:hypothetical protein